MSDDFLHSRGASWLEYHTPNHSDVGRPLCMSPVGKWAPQFKTTLKELKSMLAAGVIYPSLSPYRWPVILVKKTDGSIYFCFYYWWLNDNTKTNCYLVSCIKGVQDCLLSAIIFATLDIMSRYWQIHIREEDKETLALQFWRAYSILYECLFGLKNTGVMLQWAQYHSMMGLSWEEFQVYLDDLIIFAPTFEVLLQWLERVFHRLEGANAILGMKRSDIWGILCLRMVRPKTIELTGQSDCSLVSWDAIEGSSQISGRWFSQCLWYHCLRCCLSGERAVSGVIQEAKGSIDFCSNHGYVWPSAPLFPPHRCVCPRIGSHLESKEGQGL